METGCSIAFRKKRLAFSRKRTASLLLLFCLGTYRILAQSEGPELVLPSGHLSMVTSVTYSPDGRYVLTGSSDKTVRKWDAATGMELSVFKGAESTIRVVRFSPDGKRFAAGCNDGKILLWDYQSGALLQKDRVHTDTVSCIDFFSNEQYLSGSYDRTARVWDIAKRTAVTTISDPSYKIKAVACYPGGNYIMTGGGGLPISVQTAIGDTPAKLWDRNGRVVKSFAPGFFNDHDDINVVAFLPDHKSALVASDLRGRIFNLMTENDRPDIKFRAWSWFGAVSPDGKWMLSATDNSLHMTDLLTGKTIRKLKRLPYTMTAAAISPDGSSIVVGLVNRASVIVDALTGEPLTYLKGRSGNVLAVTFSPYGKYLATGTTDATTKIWDIENGSLVKVLSRQNFAVRSLAFSRDNKRIAAGTLGNTGKVYDIETGRELFEFSGGSGPVVFSPDGKKLMTINKTEDEFSGSLLSWASNNYLYLYDAETGKLLKNFGYTGICRSGARRLNTCAVFSPGGRYIYIGGKEDFPLKDNDKVVKPFGTIQLWDAETGKYVKTLRGDHDRLITDMDISRDGKTLVTACSDKSICFWDRLMGQDLHEYDLHESAVSTVCFSPDGKYVLTSGTDGTAHLMNLEKERDAVFKGHTAQVFAARFSPDGRFIVTGSWDNTTRFWDRNTGKELARLIPIDDSDWLVITPEGYFDGSEKALQSLYYSYKSYTFPLEQLKPRYYKKGLLPLILGYSEGKLPVIAPFSVRDLYPLVKLNPDINPRNPVLYLEVANTGGGVGKITVLLNGHSLTNSALTVSKTGVNSPGGLVRVQLPLAKSPFMHWNGENTVNVKASNSANTLSSPSVFLTFNAPPQVR